MTTQIPTNARFEVVEEGWFNCPPSVEELVVFFDADGARVDATWTRDGGHFGYPELEPNSTYYVFFRRLESSNPGCVPQPGEGESRLPDENDEVPLEDGQRFETGDGPDEEAPASPLLGETTYSCTEIEAMSDPRTREESEAFVRVRAMAPVLNHGDDPDVVYLASSVRVDISGGEALAIHSAHWSTDRNLEIVAVDLAGNESAPTTWSVSHECEMPEEMNDEGLDETIADAGMTSEGCSVGRAGGVSAMSLVVFGLMLVVRRWR